RAAAAQRRPRRARGSRLCGLGGAEAELAGDGTHRGDDVSNVLVELEPEQLGAGVDLVPVDARGKGRLLELLAHRLGLEGLDPIRPDKAAGMDEPRELV